MLIFILEFKTDLKFRLSVLDQVTTDLLLRKCWESLSAIRPGCIAI